MGNCGAKAQVKADAERGMPTELTLQKKAELQAVLDADGIKREEGEAWYIVEAAWVQRWLAFVQGDDSVKKPGPIRNDTLLVHDTGANAWVPKPLLRAARREHMGHYRRVNPHVWKMWTDSYRGSGPAIWVEIEPFEDSSNWQVDPAFGGASNSQSGGGGTAQVRGGQNSSAGNATAWQRPSTSLVKGEMEDDGVGVANVAKAAAFFDVALDSPRVASRGSGAAAGERPGAEAVVLADGGGSSGRACPTGGGVKQTRDPTAAEMWMYGGGDHGGGETKME